MAEKKETNVTVTEDNEMDLITGLLKAAEYKTEVQQPLNIIVPICWKKPVWKLML